MHQNQNQASIRFYVIDRFAQRLNKLVEIFFIKKYFVPVYPLSSNRLRLSVIVR
jgi:hypothetical protein